MQLIIFLYLILFFHGFTYVDKTLKRSSSVSTPIVKHLAYTKKNMEGCVLYQVKYYALYYVLYYIPYNLSDTTTKAMGSLQENTSDKTTYLMLVEGNPPSRLKRIL